MEMCDTLAIREITMQNGKEFLKDIYTLFMEISLTHDDQCDNIFKSTSKNETEGAACTECPPCEGRLEEPKEVENGPEKILAEANNFLGNDGHKNNNLLCLALYICKKAAELIDERTNIKDLNDQDIFAKAKST